MPRLIHSMDALNEISIEDGILRSINSVDNLRMKKRRTRRTKTTRKRTQSEDDLLRREERRQERIRRERNNSSSNICETADQSQNTNPRHSRTSTRRSRRRSVVEESLESNSSKDRPRPQTPNARKKRRRQMFQDEHVTDDEASDVQMDFNRSVIIKELQREPKSGCRDSFVERGS